MLHVSFRHLLLFVVLCGVSCGIAEAQGAGAAPAAGASAAAAPPVVVPPAGAPAVGREVKVSPIPALPVVTRGQSVPVTGENFPSQGVQVFLRTGREVAGDKGKPVDAVVAADGKSLTFKVPTGPFETGRYLVFVGMGGKELAVPGDLVVASDDTAKVRVDSIYPGTDYSNDEDNAYDFEISGDNLAPVANDNLIEVVGHGPLTIGNALECNAYAAAKSYGKVCLSYALGLEGHKLLVKGYHPAHYEGPVVFRVHTANSISDAKRVVFSKISETGLRALAVSISLVIAAIILGMVWRGIGIYRIAGENYTPLQSFFLDKETNSYSLSKFQLVAWTSVAVFGYIYLLFCQSLIQWSLKFPEIPSGWPTLLGVSAATTVTAVGITASRGAKGAGPVSPSLADFITSGGMVMSSRFQFFVWTLVGCVGFLFLTLMNDPSSLTALPDVPSGFLYLMGISAAGYLGGKLVSLPGPVVKQLVVSSVTPAAPGTPAQVEIHLKGESLSKNATVKVDDKDLRMTDEFLIECVTAQNQAPDPSFCTEVKVTLKTADNFLDGQHKLTITNKDGQMAVSDFPLDALTIKPVAAVTAGAAPVAVEVNGTNFVAAMTVKWKNAASVEVTIPAAQIQKRSDTQMVVSLTPGGAGKGTLTLVSPLGLRAHVDVNVVNP